MKNASTSFKMLVITMILFYSHFLEQNKCSEFNMFTQFAVELGKYSTNCSLEVKNINCVYKCIKILKKLE